MNVLDMNFVDLSNLLCPWTIIKTKQAIDQLSEGESLLIKANDPSFMVDCQVYLRQAGHKLKSNWHEGDNDFFLIEK